MSPEELDIVLAADCCAALSYPHAVFSFICHPSGGPSHWIARAQELSLSDRRPARRGRLPLNSLSLEPGPSFLAASPSFLFLGSSGGPVANRRARCWVYIHCGIGARVRNVRGALVAALRQGRDSRAKLPERRRSVDMAAEQM